MGYGFPAAIGAQIGNPGSTVIAISGDGGMQMNIQELETVAREKLPVKILVANNHVLGKISEIQEGFYNKRFAQTTGGSGYTVPDFKKVAQAYGIKGAAVLSYEELDEYSDWLADAVPCLIDISLSENSRLIPKVCWNSDEILPEIDAGIYQKVMELLA